MDIFGLDFETFYGDDYTLSKLTTEEYVRDPRFESILVAVKRNAEPSIWVPQPQIGEALRDLHVDRAGAYFHHAHFDGLILNLHYGIRPAMIFDTLGMARALHGANGGLSLAKLCKRYGLPDKGNEVHNVKGMHFRDFTPDGLRRYGAYSCNDIEQTYELFMRMVTQFNRQELEIHDQVIRMFTEPVLNLDAPTLRNYADNIRAEKVTLLMRAGVQVDDLMSNDKFAAALEWLGVPPPKKISPTWLKKPPAERTMPPPLTYAFAKTDPGMQELQEHPDEEVQILVEARLKNKTTLMERSAERLIGMGSRGPATVYYKYSGASGTHRLSGGDKTNFQSMKRGSAIRDSIVAPPGHMIVVGDSSNVEARVLDWLAGQEDMVEAYRAYDAKRGPDIYCVMAEKVYKRPIVKADDPDERQMGKRVKLAFGFGMGAAQFAISVRREAKGKDGRPLIIEPKFAQEVCDIYRGSHKQVKKLWERGDDALRAIAAGEIGVSVDFRGVVKTCKDGLLMPNGMKILYPELKFEPELDENGNPVKVYGKVRGEWTFWNGKARENIYGAKVIENIVQCLARIIVFGQCLAFVKECRAEQVYSKWAISSHDEGGFVMHAFEAPWGAERLLAHLRVSPAWAPDLPLNGEVGFHQRYGKAKK
ncbi:DNA polymerase [Burkholderia cenocepacia]|uniref:DNA polymerase n=1 Tax=Burkholderia cenocepacia TaxID=95486 RepID=UPI002ABD6AE1|nr:DNA polymerase [Burkholderia cenocepacia]